MYFEFLKENISTYFEFFPRWILTTAVLLILTETFLSKKESLTSWIWYDSISDEAFLLTLFFFQLFLIHVIVREGAFDNRQAAKLFFNTFLTYSAEINQRPKYTSTAH